MRCIASMPMATRSSTTRVTATLQKRLATAGVAMGRWAWSTDAWDFDHDGFPDLYVTNGMITGPSSHDLSSFFWRQVVAQAPLDGKASQDYEQAWNALNDLVRSDGTLSGRERNVFYANNRDGTFSDVSGAVGLDFLEDGRAFSLADFDHDGRLEVFLKNRSGPQLRILRNEMPDLGQSVAFRLTGRKSNRDGIGACITLETAKRPPDQGTAGGLRISFSALQGVFFGLGNDAGLLRATVRWPSGLVQVFNDLSPDHRISIEEGSNKYRAEAFHEGERFGRSAISSPGSASAPLPLRCATWLLAPVTAPDFTLPDISGAMTSLRSFRGRPLSCSIFGPVTEYRSVEDAITAIRTRALTLGD